MGLKFKQLGEYDGDIVQTILTNRQIEDIRLFLNPDNSSDTNPFEIENLLQGVQVLSAHLAVNSKMAIVVDADADGYLSSTIMFQYIKMIDANFDIDYIIHETKAHGLTEKIMDKLASKNYDLIIIPDAGSNDGDQISLLYAMGSEVLILDHHLVDDMPEHGIIVNNQLGVNSNKNLVGAGVTFKFCEAMDKTLGINFSEKLIDLVAVGQVADSSDITDNEVRKLVFEGIKNLENKFLKEALLKKEMMFPVPKDLSFSVIPLINAIVRVGTLDEKELLFRALNNINPEVTIVDKKKKNKETKKFDKIQVPMNLQQLAVDIAVKCKARQDGIVKKAVIQAEDDVWNEGGVAIIVSDLDESYSALTGLVATKMVNKLQKPVLLLRERGAEKKTYTGSGRGYSPTMDSLKDWCENTTIFEFATGHDNAFGLELVKDKLNELKEHSKKVEARDFIHEVDLVSYGEVDINIIRELDENKHIFGGRVTDSLFAYVGIEIEKKDIRAKGTVLSFYKNGVEFVLYGTTPEYQEQFTAGFARSHKLDFVGRPGINNWLGRESEQVVLEAVDFSSAEAPNIENEITEFNIVF